MKVIKLYKNSAKLIKKAQQNNREAQHVLYQLYAPKMLSVCRYYISNLQQAEEVMLNGFFKVFTKLNQYNTTGSFEGWVRRIMVREAISFLRQQKQITFSIIDNDKYYHNAVNYIDTQIEVAELQQVIDRLPHGYKIVFVMYAIEGYKHHEIATLLGVSEGTSKSQLFKAKKLLQQQLIKLNKTANDTY